MRLNLGQRIIVVVGLAAVLDAVRDWIVNRPLGDDGWFNYAPNSGIAFSPSGFSSPTGDHVVTIALVVVWVAASVWLLRSRTDTSEGGS